MRNSRGNDAANAVLALDEHPWVRRGADPCFQHCETGLDVVGTLPLCATARLSLGGLARVQITMFGARLKADWVVKHLLVGRDLVSEPRFSGLDPVRRL